MEDLLKAIDSEKNNRFKKKWPKLEKGDKINRLHLFIGEEAESKELDEKQKESLEKLLLNAFQKNNLSKNCEIEYCIKSTKILSITNLEYNEETKEYSMKLLKKINKTPSSKSKSNIDRHFSRSKGNRANQKSSSSSNDI